MSNTSIPNAESVDMSTMMQPSEPEETYWSHGWNKCKQQPLVPIGILATCAALLGATGALRSGNRAQFNRYLRFRVAAQGVTVVAAVAGTLLLTNKAEQQKDSRTRALTGQVPVDPEEGTVPVTTRSSSGSAAAAAAAAVPATGREDVSMPPLDAESSSSRRGWSSSALPPAAAAASPEGSSPSSSSDQRSGRYARPSRVSQALAETDRLLDEEGRSSGGGGRMRPMKVSEFQKRLDRAERLQKEEEDAGAAFGRK